MFHPVVLVIQAESGDIDDEQRRTRRPSVGHGRCRGSGHPVPEFLPLDDVSRHTVI